MIMQQPSNMDIYTRSLDEIVPILNAVKGKIRRFLHRNFQVNVHFIELPRSQCEGVPPTRPRHGGQNRIDVRLTDQAFELVINSYNWRNRNIVENIGNTSVVPVVQPIETQTINFIKNCFNTSYRMIQQYRIGNYRADLYIEDYAIVVECDEFGHTDRNPEDEYQREQAIYAAGIREIIRYNPNQDGFSISNVVDRILSAIRTVEINQYTPENYTRLLIENDKLKKSLHLLRRQQTTYIESSEDPPLRTTNTK